MNNPEQSTKGTFDFVRGVRTSPTGSSEIDSIPERGVRGATTEEAATANAGTLLGKAERFVIDSARKHPIRVASATIGVGGAIAGALAAIGAFQNNIPGIHESTPSNSVFDNKADKGTISADNAIIIYNLEYLKTIATIPQSSEDGHAINILMPLQGIPSGGIDYTRDLVGKNPSNPIYAPEARQYALKNGIRNEIFLKNIPAGFTILAPVDGEFMYDRIRNDIPEGTLDSVTFFFKDENGILYQISIADASAKPLAPILDVPARGIKDNYRNFIQPIEKGDPVLKVLQRGEITIWAHAWPSGQLGLEEVSPGDIKHVYPVNINLITYPDLSTGKGGIVIVPK